MADRELAVAGPLDSGNAWERYADLDAWSTWAPAILAVDCNTPRLTTGIVGVVRTFGGLGVPFEVEACDHDARRWRWKVRIGPAEMTLDHEILDRSGGGCVATLRLEGPWPLITAYAPAAQFALTRLVRR